MNFEIIKNEQTPKAINCNKNFLESEKGFILDKERPWVEENVMTALVKFAKGLDNCVGLAANQVSLDGERLNLNFFIMKNNNLEVCINPEIIENNSNLITKIEGCLTWPGKKIIAKRYSEIHVKYYNHKGDKIIDHLKGFNAQIFQHEFNHLQGINENFEYEKSQERNSLCNCGSGKKFKKCCNK